MKFNQSWIGPTDYCCETCHFGFTLDETVYIEKDGLPFHKQCLDPIEFSNRIQRGVTIITPANRGAANDTAQ